LIISFKDCSARESYEEIKYTASLFAEVLPQSQRKEEKPGLFF